MNFCILHVLDSPQYCSPQIHAYPEFQSSTSDGKIFPNVVKFDIILDSASSYKSNGCPYKKETKTETYIDKMTM